MMRAMNAPPSPPPPPRRRPSTSRRRRSSCRPAAAARLAAAGERASAARPRGYASVAERRIDADDARDGEDAREVAIAGEAKTRAVVRLTGVGWRLMRSRPGARSRRRPSAAIVVAERLAERLEGLGEGADVDALRPRPRAPRARPRPRSSPRA